MVEANCREDTQERDEGNNVKVENNFSANQKEDITECSKKKRPSGSTLHCNNDARNQNNTQEYEVGRVAQ